MANPTVYGTSRFGVVDDTSATDLHVASLSYSYSTEQARGKNSTGFSVALAFFEDATEVTASGVVAVKTTGMVFSLGDAMVLANESADSLSLNDYPMMSTPVGSAGTVVTGGSIERSNGDFETGSLNLLYLPLVALS